MLKEVRERGGEKEKMGKKNHKEKGRRGKRRERREEKGIER